MGTDRAGVESVPVAVFARAPLAGRAKTRLSPMLGPAGAARAHRQLVLRTVRTVRRSGMPLQLWCEPSGQARFFRALQRVCDCAGQTQVQGDLGHRMHAAFEAHAGRGPLLLIGTDCPLLDPAHLQQAAQRLLDGEDAVFTPAEDGGYVLVGLSRPQAALFESVDWGTNRVMAQTRSQLQKMGLRWSEMPMLWDVDEPADWLRWQQIGL